MKFMKLGSKPDAFQADGDSRYVLSDLPSDIVVHVKEARFYLHKFPLLSKSSLLQKLIIEASQSGGDDEVYVDGIPGGARAFEICAKFCYGMVVTLNAHNVVAARCAAEYLGMSEDVDKGNLVFKLEVFLASGVFRSWKDSITALQSTAALLPWSEELKLVARCTDAIASKAAASPGSVVWSYTYNRKAASSDEIVEERRRCASQGVVPRDWWVEDLCELDVELYRRVMVAVKSVGSRADVVGEALRAYAARWLLENCLDDDDDDEGGSMAAYLNVLETIVWLLPKDDDDASSCCCSCQFLLNLLKFAVAVGAGEPLREELTDRVARQLHEASVGDLLIPARPPAQTIYDVELVKALVGRYMWRRAGVGEDGLFLCGDLDREVEADESLLTLCKLVDGYLAEVAADPNLPVSSFVGLATSMPEPARPAHDGLYTAIDVFLKVRPNLGKLEKRKISGLMDVKKLSKEACIHAAQNDRLPLRVVVQVLFFEQLRAAAPPLSAGASNGLELEDDGWTNQALALALPEAAPPTPAALRRQLGSLKLAGEVGDGGGDGRRLARSASIANQSSRLSLSSRSRRIFDRLWVGGKLPGGEVVSKSSDTSGSSQSPRSSAVPPNKSSSSRNRRYSVS